jgi:hypothetical protein
MAILHEILQKGVPYADGAPFLLFRSHGAGTSKLEVELKCGALWAEWRGKNVVGWRCGYIQIIGAAVALWFFGLTHKQPPTTNPRN